MYTHPTSLITRRCRSRVVLCLAALCVLTASGCAQLPHHRIVKGPTTTPPLPPPPPPANGSLFEAAYTRPLFEDRRPRAVGDIITVVLNEQVSATKSSAANASRNGGITFKPKVIPKVLGSYLGGQSADISGSNTFSGKGGANASNTFTGKITVTVMRVLPNGNLAVAGEKQIGINQGTEYILFSGKVNPQMISADSTITSSQVADARLEYYGDGYIDEAQHMGWLQRVLLNLSPF